MYMWNIAIHNTRSLDVCTALILYICKKGVFLLPPPPPPL